ncbi:MAG: hypothetical protein WB566_13170 [Terriglobales bacterium]
MRLLRRILITVVVTLAVAFVGVYGIVVVSSFYTAKKAPFARIVPTALKDESVSEAPGTKLSYFGYELEVPWTDLDGNQTKLYPKDKPDKFRVDLHFRSGLRLLVSAIPPREWANTLVTEFKVPPRKVEAATRSANSALKSDYGFEKNLYELTPDKMHYWALSPDAHMSEAFWLTIKSVVLSNSAASGIFILQNQSYKGFQQGNPQVRPYGIVLHLYSDEGSVEMILSQKDYKHSAGVTQPEINRIVRSLRKVTQNESATPRIAQK